MNKKRLITIFSMALIFRVIYAWLGWNTSIIEAYDNSITVVYQRSAYLVSFGYGYKQAIPDTRSYYELENTIAHISNNKSYTTKFPEHGLFETTHYPPGYPLVGAALFNLTDIPISFLYQILGILCDLLTMYLLYRFTLSILTDKQLYILLFIYAISPPIIALSVSMTPDSLMPLLVVSSGLVFYNFYKSNKFKYLLLLGIVTGLGAYFRSDYIFLPFFFNIIFLVGFSWKLWRKYFKYNITIITISFLILMPWAIRNKQVTGEFMLTSSSLGATLVSGLASLPNPWNLGPTDCDRFDEANLKGFDTPFESGANTYFKQKFIEYVKEEPGYYLKTCVYRIAYFVAAPYTWGFEDEKTNTSFSEIRNDGAIVDSIGYLLSKYWTNILSSIVSFMVIIILTITYIKNRRNIVLLIIISSYLCVLLSHIFIHMTSVYSMSLFPFQVIGLTLLLTVNRKLKVTNG